jgi:methionine-rich copper-binding protein CopC
MRFVAPRPIFLIFSLLISLAGWFAIPRTAEAHAVLQKSEPAANAAIDLGTLHVGMLPIELTFNSRIDAAHSSLSLHGADGKPIVLTPIDLNANPNILRCTAPSIHPGHYSLHWQVVASDGHISRGAIPFDVR